MKYRLLGVAALVAMMAVTGVLASMDPETADTRIHQHLTARQPEAG